MNGRERFLAACSSQAVDKIPVWVMRQAGRYLPEYRALKKQYSFLELAQTPKLAAEVTLQPLKRFDLDAAITFSDILVIPEALGQAYSFREQGGIEMAYAIETASDLKNLSVNKITEKLSYVASAQEIIRENVGYSKALLGFGGSPWTLATYMIEGGSTQDYSKVKNFVNNEQKTFTGLMEILCESLIAYFKMQIKAGVDAIQIFDSWAAACEEEVYWEHSLKWIQRIIQELPSEIPIILYSKRNCYDMNLLQQTGAQVFSIGPGVALNQLRSKTNTYALQGNLAPELMTGPKEDLEQAALGILNEMGDMPGFIFNLGHGITPQAKIENMELLVNTVHNYEIKNNLDQPLSALEK
jgi:uroporphyrinogen decarboxylase